MYHGIIIDQSFKDPTFVKSFKQLNHKTNSDWGVYGIEVEDEKLHESIKLIQENLKSDQPWYCHIYNDQGLVIFLSKKYLKLYLTDLAGIQSLSMERV